MDAATKTRIMCRYQSHVARFERAAEARRRWGVSYDESADPAPPSPELPPAAESLTASERVALSLIARGFTDREIGRLIGISTNTVKAHVRNVLAKLEARNRAQAVAIALKHELVEPD